MALTKEDLQAIGELIDSKLDSRLTPMQSDMAEMKSDMAEMKSDMAEVKERVTIIELTQENRILPHIQLLAEGHSGLVDRLDRLEALPEQVEDIQNTVSVLKHVFKTHTHK